LRRRIDPVIRQHAAAAAAAAHSGAGHAGAAAAAAAAIKAREKALLPVYQQVGGDSALCVWMEGGEGVEERGQAASRGRGCACVCEHLDRWRPYV
jgi:hypothetical protein